MSDDPPAVGFYHLTRDPVDVALPKLLERALRDGHRIIVRSASAAQVDRLDAALWSYEKDSFLPHGTDRNDAQDLQPILLTTANMVPNGATVLVLLDNILPDEVAAFKRVVYMFDGGVEDQLQQARRHWLDFKGRGLPLTYWQQTDAGGWRKAAEA